MARRKLRMPVARWYALDEAGEPVESDAMAASMALSSELSRVACTEVSPGATLSTVFLALDHGRVEGGPPILFESLWFGDDCNQLMRRYSTRAEAVAGHEQMLMEYCLENGGTDVSTADATWEAMAEKAEEGDATARLIAADYAGEVLGDDILAAWLRLPPLAAKEVDRGADALLTSKTPVTVTYFSPAMTVTGAALLRRGRMWRARVTKRQLEEWTLLLKPENREPILKILEDKN